MAYVCSSSTENVGLVSMKVGGSEGKWEEFFTAALAFLEEDQRFPRLVFNNSIHAVMRLDFFALGQGSQSLICVVLILHPPQSMQTCQRKHTHMHTHFVTFFLPVLILIVINLINLIPSQRKARHH